MMIRKLSSPGGNGMINIATIKMTLNITDKSLVDTLFSPN
ncbi:hypothetical protein B4102_1037 [Heyndrickxia sporothermodurans]|uniref:Uncharacterized protein n=1 Tax=Heyndrickxia sporothermodurans TaxID=46224 RepID=A0A150KQA1_9BACI|nr:hypothetical protein B4102_1037 [Heyndrickxia sporothermodurans]